MKLKNNKGETIVELLVAILISSLAVTLLFNCAMTSMKINDTAKKADTKLYTALNAAESQSSDAENSGIDGQIKVQYSSGAVQKEIDFNVKYYGSDKVYSYTRTEGND